MDQRHRFVGSTVWAPPFRKISNKPARLLLDGFNFATIVTIASGQPETEVLSSFPSGGVDGGLTGGAINLSALATPGRAPFLPRNNFILPTLYNVDFRIAREFRIRERLKLSLVGEAFNPVQPPADFTQAGPEHHDDAERVQLHGSRLWNLRGSYEWLYLAQPGFPDADADNQRDPTAPRQLQDISARLWF